MLKEPRGHPENDDNKDDNCRKYPFSPEAGETNERGMSRTSGKGCCLPNPGTSKR